MKRLCEIYNDESVHSVRAELREEGFNLERVKRQPRKQLPSKLQTKNKSPVRIAPVPKAPKLQRLSVALKNTDVGSQSANREWEVGQKKDEEDVERRRGMKW